MSVSIGGLQRSLNDAKLKNQNTKTNIQSLDEEFLSSFPMKSLTSINDIETRIKNDNDFRIKVVSINLSLIFYNTLILLSISYSHFFSRQI